MSRSLFGVSGHFSASHRDQMTGEMHGHTWHVLAKFETRCQVDSVCYRAALHGLLSVWDHTILPDELAWGEAIARAVGRLTNCVEVEVSRPAEGFYAWWIGETDFNTYSHTFTAVCPNNGSLIPYELEIQTQAVIMVEDIIAACDVVETFHEPLADKLAEQFGGKQLLAAFHHGVRIQTIRGSI